MRDDDDQAQHYVPLLRRIIILVAVLTAVPVILWTITAFVRSYVGPPRLPTFHQLAGAESNQAPATTNADAGDRPQAPAEQAKGSDSSTATVAARAMTPATREVSAAPKGSVLADRLPDSDTNMPTSAVKTTDASPPAPPASAMKTSDASPAPPPSLKATDMAAAPATPDAAAISAAFLAAQQPVAVNAPPADAMPATAPLSGPIPLPRRRPKLVAETPMTHMAQINVPMPRPRPDAAGTPTPPETGSGPLDFLQNLFH